MALSEAGDRRHRRRQETIEEILDRALEIMSEQGAGALSLGEVARRVGVRPPSLYVYFPSKFAHYDALFARGARSILAAVQSAYDEDAAVPDLRGKLLRAGRAFACWCLANQAYAQLLFWRPVPGFEPSPEAFAPAVELVGLTERYFTELQRDGLLRHDADLGEAIRNWIVLTSGIISQQLANAPDEDCETGRFTAALPSLVEMFLTRYAATPS